MNKPKLNWTTKSPEKDLKDGDLLIFICCGTRNIELRAAEVDLKYDPKCITLWVTGNECACSITDFRRVVCWAVIGEKEKQEAFRCCP